MRLRLGLAAAVLAVGTLVAPGFVTAAHAASACAAGQPNGRPPGNPPGTPAQPPGRPPQYPIGQCELALSQSAAARGATIRAAGAGFASSAPVTLSLCNGANVGSATTDSGGSFSGSLTIPANAPLGPCSVTATDVAGSSQSAALLITSAEVPAAAAGPTGSLPRTGSSTTIPMIAAGGLLVLGGAALVLASRRRTGTAQS